MKTQSENLTIRQAAAAGAEQLTVLGMTLDGTHGLSQWRNDHLCMTSLNCKRMGRQKTKVQKALPPAGVLGAEPLSLVPQHFPRKPA